MNLSQAKKILKQYVYKYDFWVMQSIWSAAFTI